MDEGRETVTEALAGAGDETYGGFGHDTPFVALSGRFHEHDLFHDVTATAEDVFDGNGCVGHGGTPYEGLARVPLLTDADRQLPDAVTLADLAADHGVSEAALGRVTLPAHERVGRTLVRPAVLEELGERLSPGMQFEAAEATLEEYGIDDSSSLLSALGYRVEWEGLSGGVLRQ